MGIWPRDWLVPLLLSEHELNVNTVPSEHLTRVIPASPFLVRWPRLRTRTAYCTFSWHTHTHTHIHTYMWLQKGFPCSSAYYCEYTTKWSRLKSVQFRFLAKYHLVRINNLKSKVVKSSATSTGLGLRGRERTLIGTGLSNLTSAMSLTQSSGP